MEIGVGCEGGTEKACEGSWAAQVLRWGLRGHLWGLSPAEQLITGPPGFLC